MISENEKNKYQSIKAPEELKQRIANDIKNIQPSQNKKSNHRIIETIAACVLVAFVVGFVGVGMNSSTVYLNGETFYGEEINLPQSSMVQRASVVGSQVVEIDCRFETKISAENGEFTLLDYKTGEEIYTGNQYSVEGKVVIAVNVPEGEKTILKLQNILSEREIAFNSNAF
jgi:hypothetical protein